MGYKLAAQVMHSSYAKSHPRQKAILWFLANMWNEKTGTGKMWNAAAATVAGCSVEMVRRYKRALEADGVVSFHETRGKGRSTPYVLHMERLIDVLDASAAAEYDYFPHDDYPETPTGSGVNNEDKTPTGSGVSNPKPLLETPKTPTGVGQNPNPRVVTIGDIDLIDAREARSFDGSGRNSAPDLFEGSPNGSHDGKLKAFILSASCETDEAAVNSWLSNAKLHMNGNGQLTLLVSNAFRKTEVEKRFPKSLAEHRLNVQHTMREA